MLEILIFTHRNFTKLPILRYLDICNVLHTCTPILTLVLYIHTCILHTNFIVKTLHTIFQVFKSKEFLGVTEACLCTKKIYAKLLFFSLVFFSLVITIFDNYRTCYNYQIAKIITITSIKNN